MVITWTNGIPVGFLMLYGLSTVVEHLHLLTSLLVVEVLLTYMNSSAAQSTCSWVVNAVQIKNISHVYYKRIKDGKLHLLRLIVLDCFGEFSYCMEMSQYSVVLALNNAQSGTGESPDGKILSNVTRNDMPRFAWMFFYSQLHHKSSWLLLLLFFGAYIKNHNWTTICHPML